MVIRNFWRKLRRREAAAQTAGVAAGMSLGAVGGAVAGPSGAALGHLLGPAVVATFRSIDQQQTSVAWDTALEVSGLRPEQVAVMIQTDIGKAQLLREAVETSTRAIAEVKLRTIGRALAAGLLSSDDAELNVEHMIISALADLEAPHIQVLARMREGAAVAETGADPPVVEATKFKIGDLKGQTGRSDRDGIGLPHLAVGMEGLVAALASHGLVEGVQPDWGGAIEHVASLEGPSIHRAPRAGEFWKITAFGIELHDRVNDAGASALDTRASKSD